MGITWEKFGARLWTAVRIEQKRVNKYSFIKYKLHKNKKVVDIYTKSGMITKGTLKKCGREQT
ncbi:hypothetical protein AMURIS_02054 [Acetatifactor muris]|uniref:Uncharacterized protein n=1 Tax=Acetatifactor muris TaxID=879566 RepID=A0A2K4ZFV7_9FIRM|nr:hypothetical protein AMURIS_02054 [Acetatifactor muris]